VAPLKPTTSESGRLVPAGVIHGEFVVAPLKLPVRADQVRDSHLVIHGEFVVAPLKLHTHGVRFAAVVASSTANSSWPH